MYLKRRVMNHLVNNSQYSPDPYSLFLGGDDPSFAKLNPEINALYNLVLRKKFDDERKIGEYLSDLDISGDVHYELNSNEEIDIPKTIRTWLRQYVTIYNISSKKYLAFRKIVGIGDIDFCQTLWQSADPSQKYCMLSAEKYSVITVAAVHGHLNIFDWLENIANAKQKKDIRLHYTTVFLAAVENGHLYICTGLISRGVNIDNLLHSRGSKLFSVAAKNNHLQMAFWLLEVASENQRKVMIESEMSTIFENSLANNLPNVFEFIWQVTDDQQHVKLLSLEDILKDYLKTGWSPIYQLLWSLTSTEQHTAIISDFNVFHEVKSLSGCQWLWEIANDDQKSSIALSDKNILYQKNPRLSSEVFYWFWSVLNIEQRKTLITRDGHFLFNQSVINGHLEVSKVIWLMIDQPHRSELLSNDNMMSFRNALRSRNLPLCQWLWELFDQEFRLNFFNTPENIESLQFFLLGNSSSREWLWCQTNQNQRKVILADISTLFVKVLSPQKLEICQWFWEQADQNQRNLMLEKISVRILLNYLDYEGFLEFAQWLSIILNFKKINALVAADNYCLFRYSSRHFKICRWLWESADEIQRHDMIAAEDYGAFEQALSYNNGCSEWIWSVANPKQQNEMLSMNGYRLFQKLINYPHSTKAAQRLWDFASLSQRHEMLSGGRYHALFLAADNGHLENCQWIWSLADFGEHLTWIWTTGALLTAFRLAAEKHHIEVCRWIFCLVNVDQRQRLLREIDTKKITDIRGFREKEFARWLICVIKPKEEKFRLASVINSHGFFRLLDQTPTSDEFYDYGSDQYTL